MDEDRIRWDERHRDRPPAVPTPPEIVAAHPELDELLPTRGVALDLACGTGAVTLWAAVRGLDVVALDVSPVAIGAVDTASTLLAPHATARVHAAEHDIDGGLPTAAAGVDLRRLDLVVCQRFRATNLLGELVDRLHPGGVLLVTVLSAVGLEGDAGPFHAPPGELRSTLDRPDLDVLVDTESDGLASMAVRRRV